MSDDDYYDDDDEYLVLEDFPFNEAEDLAAHTVHSPVLVNYDASWETVSLASDWDYYSDEYWEEQGPPKKRKPKGDSDEDAEATVGTDNVKKKRREGKSRGIPELYLGGPSLAGSTVVWKSNKETTESHDGPLVTDGQGEKVSLLTDWRERFKLSTTIEPKARQPMNRHKALATDAGDSPPEEYHNNGLASPPTTLEGLKGLPSRTRAVPTPLRELALEINGTALCPSFDEDSDLDEDISGSNDVVKSCGSQRVLAVELPDQAAVIAPCLRRKPGKPKKQQPSNAMKWKGSEGEFESGMEKTTSSRKRKAASEKSSSDDATEVPNRHTERCRSKEQRPSTTSEESQLELSVETTPPLGTKRRGRPKKQKTSPLSKAITGNDLGTHAAPTEKKNTTHPTHNGSMQPGSADSFASIRGKRKVSVSEDELSMPPPKKRNNVEKDAQTTAVADPIARRSMRKK